MGVRLSLAVAVSAMLVAAAGCSGGSGPPSPPTTAAGATTVSGGSSTSAAGPTTTVTLPGAATTPTSVAGTGPAGVALLVAVRAARQPGFDRVVFEFEGPTVPPAEVRYLTRPIVQDGSGAEVTVNGAAVLGVRMAPASGVDLSGATFRQTYTGPARFTPGDTVLVKEVVRTGDFEAVLNWAIGTSPQAPFLVRTFTNPSRLVVDIAG